MNADVQVIWQRGDSDMPGKTKYVVDQARDELLLRILRLPNEVIESVKSNAERNEQTVNDYLSAIVTERLRIA